MTACDAHCHWCGRRLTAATSGKVRGACSHGACQARQRQSNRAWLAAHAAEKAAWDSHIREILQALPGEPRGWTRSCPYIPPITPSEAIIAIATSWMEIRQWRAM